MSKCWKTRITFFQSENFSPRDGQSGNLCMGRTSWPPQPRAAPMLSSFRTQGTFRRICDIQIRISIHICDDIVCKLWGLLPILWKPSGTVRAALCIGAFKLLEFGHIIEPQMANLAKWSMSWRRRAKIWQWLKASQRRCIKKWCCYPLTILYAKLNNIS